jgi:hypothetical protein
MQMLSHLIWRCLSGLGRDVLKGGSLTVQAVRGGPEDAINIIYINVYFCSSLCCRSAKKSMTSPSR